MAEASLPLRPAARRPRRLLPSLRALDTTLLLSLGALLCLGLVMVASASVAVADRGGDALELFQRQALYAALALVAGAVALRVPLVYWQAASTALLVFGCFLLTLVLVPGIGLEVNGARRWLPLVLFNLQVSEVARLCVLMYLSGYLVRRQHQLHEHRRGFFIPMAVLALVAALLLAEPDFGAAAVLTATGLAMLFIAGAPLGRFVLLIVLVSGIGSLLLLTSPYRMERLTGFMNPWADPFDTGFQLTQALIAIGRGGWFGVGLGNSVQKLFYLPEAHTDFLFSVLAEELGLAGIAAVVLLYGIAVWRTFGIAARALRAERPFGAYLTWGIGFWFGLQAFVNMGVNMGLLPTKGLTLPLMSYGGSSLVMTVVAMALVLRVDYETRIATAPARPTGGPGGRHG
jgi:cell division protein FtsW